MTAKVSSPTLPRGKSKTGYFLLHTFLALFGATFLSVLLVAVSGNLLPHFNDVAIEDMEALGVVFAIACCVGFLANRLSLTHAACWVWIPGLTWLALGIWDYVRHYDPRWHQGCSASQDVVRAFFVGDHKCGGGEEVLNALFFTTPAICSVAYSFGAWVALRMGQRKKKTFASAHLA